MAARLPRRLLCGAYLALLLASQVFVATRPEAPPPEPHGGSRVEVGASPRALSALRWSAAGASSAPGSAPPFTPAGPGSPADARLPVLLLHGSPGDATNLAALGERLAAHGREALAFDLPGFGASARVPGGRSIRAHAEASLVAAPWPAFHVVGWSMGGGVGLHMAALGERRVRSLALIASIGVQAAEGSGSYGFEHVKYAANAALVLGLAELVPHFGMLPSRAERAGYARNFWESDQRPLEPLIAALDTPLFVAHGRRDFLVPLWCAERTHELARDSRLVVLEASHFLPLPGPFGDLERLAPELEAFLARHDRPGVVETRARVELDPPRPDARPEPFLLARRVPWWASFVAATLAAAFLGAWAGFPLGAAAALLQVDAGLAVLAGALGMLAPALRARAARPAALLAWGGGSLRFLGAFLAAAAFTSVAGEPLCRRLGAPLGVAASVCLPALVAGAVALAMRRLSRRGRERATARRREGVKA